MKISNTIMPTQLRDATIAHSELELLKAIKEFTSFFGAADVTDTISNLLTEYTNPEGKEDGKDFPVEHIHDTVFTTTRILTFLVNLESLYERYIHFHAEKLEEINNLN